MTTFDNNQFIQSFRESAPYINAHRGETFVILLNNDTLACPNLANIVHDLALLNSLGVRLILVLNVFHGANPLQHITPVITQQAELEQLKLNNGKYRCDLEALFSSGLPNTPMHGANIHVVSGNFVTAKPVGIINGIDHQYSGSVRRIHTQAIRQLLDNRQIVLLPNLAYSTTGECFYVTGEEIAVSAGKAMRANKLLTYASDKDLKKLPHELLPSSAEALYKKYPLPQLYCLLKGCEQGILRNHMISHEQDGALLSELFTRDGSGIMLSKDAFETIEAATISDVGGIMELLKPLEAAGILVKREPEKLEQEIAHFIVIKRDNVIIACSALYPYDNKTAEIACVATHPDYQGGNRGTQMLNYLEQKATSLDVKTLFVLTTQSAHFFLEQGYKSAAMSTLPHAKQALYNWQRNAKVFSKKIK